jgi:glycosyltransferase involved in cell wall biosynthesis
MGQSIVKKKVFMVTNIPTPYRLPLFKVISEKLATKEIVLKVIFGGPGYARRKWHMDFSQYIFSYHILKPWKFRIKNNQERTFFLYPGLLRIILHEKPELIIVIGFSFATLQILLYKLITGKRYIIWSGSIHNIYVKRGFFRNIIRKCLISHASGFVAYGSKAKDYLISMGAPAERIEIGINTTDTEFYFRETERLRSQVKKLPVKQVLYFGYLTSRKRIDLVLYALARINKLDRDFNFVIVGDGPKRDSIFKMAAKLGIADKVQFTGFKQKTEIPAYLAIADCFVFPSEYDIWGLVLVEAMAAGLPCISSVLSGATIDLIQEGETGFALDFSETEKVAERILWIFDHPEEATRIGANASRFIRENVNIEKSAAGFVRSIESVLALRKEER